MESLDPRINRLRIKESAPLLPKAPLDQFGTFEVFTQLNENKPYQHAGIVHAPNADMAFLFAKEQFSRRQTCSGLFVADTRNIFVTPITDGDTNVYGIITTDFTNKGTQAGYEFFHLYKRGNQHKHVGSIDAKNPQHALAMAKNEFLGGKPIYNVWVIKTTDILFSDENDKVIWETLPDKKFRDAITYKAGDKLKSFKAKHR